MFFFFYPILKKTVTSLSIIDAWFKISTFWLSWLVSPPIVSHCWLESSSRKFLVNFFKSEQHSHREYTKQNLSGIVRAAIHSTTLFKRQICF